MGGKQPSGPSLGRLGRPWAVKSHPATKNDANQRKTFPLVSAAFGASIRQPAWSPQKILSFLGSIDRYRGSRICTKRRVPVGMVELGLRGCGLCRSALV
jgi:hypothetical protein